MDAEPAAPARGGTEVYEGILWVRVNWCESEKIVYSYYTWI